MSAVHVVTVVKWRR